VLTEESARMHSLIRVVDTFAVSGATLRFFVVCHLHSSPSDTAPHVLTIQMMGRRDSNWIPLAGAPPKVFKYGYNLNPSGPGGFVLSTEFNLDMNKTGFGLFYIQALLDGQLVAQVPLTLRPQ
jgi:hypothetical protein